MTQALPTQAEIEGRLLAARVELCRCEDCGDRDGAILARTRCDELLEQWSHAHQAQG